MSWDCENASCRTFLPGQEITVEGLLWDEGREEMLVEVFIHADKYWLRGPWRIGQITPRLSRLVDPRTVQSELGRFGVLLDYSRRRDFSEFIIRAIRRADELSNETVGEVERRLALEELA